MRRYINNQRELFTFHFDGVLPASSKQDKVWHSHSVVRHHAYTPAVLQPP